MTERTTEDTQVRAPHASAPEVSERDAAGAVGEGAGESVAPQPATEGGDEPAPAAATADPQAAVEAPAPALDASATTPDRSSSGSSQSSSDGPPAHLLVGGAFAGGLALAIVLRMLGDD
jgi:cobalamin biosynthesis Mg chelatase CobN